MVVRAVPELIKRSKPPLQTGVFMGKLFRYDYIEEGRSNPIILSFRLTIQIPEHLCDQLQDYLDVAEPPSSCFLSQLYAKKIDDSFYLVITVNLLSFYELWSKPFEYTYKNIVNLLREKICDRFGLQFTDYFIRHENLDCDFIEYAFITRDRDSVIRDMWECHASSEQMSKTHWDEYFENHKKNCMPSQKSFYNDEELLDFLSCCITYNSSDYAKTVDTNSTESYNSCHNDFYECYVRCYGPQLQHFFGILDKKDFVGNRGVLLKYLFDDNFKKTLCQCAYEYGCHRSCSTAKIAKLIYKEYCKEFGNPLEGPQDDGYYELDWKRR